jgi:adenylate cyclase
LYAWAHARVGEIPLRKGHAVGDAPDMQPTASRTVLATRIQRFRFGAYWWFAALLAVLARDADPPTPVWVGAIVVPVIPWLLRLMKRGTGLVDDAENAAVPALVALISLPLLPSVAVVGALLTGVVAQRGWNGLLRCAVLAFAGWCAGMLLAPGIHYRTNLVTDALCLAFIVFYTTPLCAFGYEQTMRMHRMRERLRATSVDLQRQRDRLSRYVAAPVTERLAEASVAKAPLERRWLTVAFVDIADFTALTERLAPEDLTSMLDAFFAEVSDSAAQHGGVLHKFIGDAVLISFGEARSEGRRADARACIAMLGQLDALVDRLNRIAQARGIPAVLAVRAGVASGYCSVGDFGADTRMEYTMIGAAVNLASRLESIAAPGEVWAAQPTRDLLPADLFEPLGTFDVKGFDEPLPAFRLRVTPSVDAGQAAI